MKKWELSHLPSQVAADIKLSKHQMEIAIELNNLEKIKTKLLPKYYSFDPSWKMMLDLLVEHHCNRPTSVSDLCLASGVSMTTALRYITILESDGYLKRKADSFDKRRFYLYLTSKSIVLIEKIISRFEKN